MQHINMWLLGFDTTKTDHEGETGACIVDWCLCLVLLGREEPEPNVVLYSTVKYHTVRALVSVARKALQ